MTPFALPGIDPHSGFAGIAKAASLAQSLTDRIVHLTGLRGVPGKVEESVAGVRDFASRQIDEILNGATSAAKSTAQFAEATLQRAGTEIDHLVGESLATASTALQEISHIPGKAMDLLNRAEQIKERAQRRGSSMRSRAKAIRSERLGSLKLASTHWLELASDVEEELDLDAEEMQHLGDAAFEEALQNFDHATRDARHQQGELLGQVETTHQRATRLKNQVSGGIASTKDWAAYQARKAARFRSEQLAAAKGVGSLEAAGAWAADSVEGAKQLAGSIRSDASRKPREVASFGQRRIEEAMQISSSLRQGVQTARKWICAQTHAQAAWRIAMNANAQRSSAIMERQVARIKGEIAVVRRQMDQPVPSNLATPIEESVREVQVVDEAADGLLDEPIHTQPTPHRPNPYPEPHFPMAVIEQYDPPETPFIRPLEPSAAVDKVEPRVDKHSLRESSSVRPKRVEPATEALSFRTFDQGPPMSAAAPRPPVHRPLKATVDFEERSSPPLASTPDFPPFNLKEQAETPKPTNAPQANVAPAKFPEFNLKTRSRQRSKASSRHIPTVSAPSHPGQAEAPQIPLPPTSTLGKPKLATSHGELAQSHRLPPLPKTAPKRPDKPVPSPTLAANPSPRAVSGPQQPEQPREFHDRLLATAGPGTAPDVNVRSQLTPHVGFDPAMVRLHTGPVAQSAARSLRADAFTIGRDVFFGAGKYNPTSPSGLGLIGHEVTHVGQQLGLRGDKLRFHTKTGGDAMEQEAQQVGERIASNISAGAGLRVEGFVRQYLPADDEPLTAHLQSRLDQLSLRALNRAGSSLRPKRRDMPIRLDEVNVDLTLDMEAMSDIEIIEVWAEAIVAAVEAAQPHGRVSAATLKERLLQRQPGDPAPLPDPKPLPKSSGLPTPPAPAVEAHIKAKLGQMEPSSEDKKMIRQLHVRKVLDKHIKAAKEEQNSFKYKALKVASGVTLIRPLEFDEEDLPYINAMLKEYEIASVDEYQLIEGQFIKMFWTKGILATKHLLDENKKIALHEMERYWDTTYGAKGDMEKLRVIAGKLSDEAFWFTDRYNAIVKQENLYNRRAKVRPLLPSATSSQMTMIGSVLTEVNLPSSYYEELRPRWDKWMKDRAKHGKEFPILLSDFDISDIRGEADKGKLASKMGEHVGQILDNINYVYGELDEDRFWKLPKMIDLTRDTLGFRNTDGAGITLTEYITNKKEDEALWEMIKAAAAIALAIVGMVATGGLAAVAMVGSAAMSVHSAVKASYDYAFNKAAVNTAVETAKRISKDEPSLLALAVEIVGAFLDVGGAMHAFNSIKSAAKAANALDPQSMSKLRETAADAYETALKEGGSELKMTKESFVNRIVDFGAKGMATAEHSSDKLRLMAELSKGTSNRVRLLMKNDAHAIQKLLDDFGEVDELVDILLECGEEGKKILTNVGNHIHAKQVKAADAATDSIDDVSKAGKAADNIHDPKLPDAPDNVVRPNTQAPLHLPPPKKPWNRKDLKVILEGTQEGRHALAVVERYQIKVLKQRTRPGQVFFQPPDKIYIWHDMRPQQAMYGYIHEAGHAEWLKTGKTADIYQTHRDLYITKMIREEAEVQTNAIKARIDLAGFNSGGQVQFDAPTALEKTFLDAYNHYAGKYRQMIGDEVQPWMVNEYATKMAKNVMHSAISRGEVTATVGNIDYVTYYGRQWDRVRLGANGSPMPRSAMVPPGGPPKGWTPSLTGPQIISGAAQSHLTDAQNAVKSVATLPKGSLDSSIGLSSAGSAGSIGLGVHPTTFRGQPVVVKLYYQNQAAILEGEMAALLAAEKTGYGPKVHGKITYQTQSGDTRIGIAMDRVEGGFADMADGSGAALVRAKAEMMANAKNINAQTFRDLYNFRDRLIEQGYYYWGELQGFVDKNGRWRPIDLQGANPIHELDPRHAGLKSAPNLSESEAIKRHNKAFEKMFDKLYANQQAAKKTTP